MMHRTSHDFFTIKYTYDKNNGGAAIIYLKLMI